MATAARVIILTECRVGRAELAATGRMVVEEVGRAELAGRTEVEEVVIAGETAAGKATVTGTIWEMTGGESREGTTIGKVWQVDSVAKGDKMTDGSTGGGAGAVTTGRTTRETGRGGEAALVVTVNNGVTLR